MGQAALQDTVPGNFAHVTGAELEDLGSDGVLLHEGFLQAQAVLEAPLQPGPPQHTGPSANTAGFPEKRAQLPLYLGIMELHGVICRKGHHEAPLVVVRQWVLCVLQEEAVVAEWGHSNGNLGKEVQVLQHRGLQRRAELPG